MDVIETAPRGSVLPTMMPFRVRLTIGFVLTLVAFSARGQDPYAPTQYRQAPAAQPPGGQYPLPPASQYPLPSGGQYPLPQQPSAYQQPAAAGTRYPLPQQQYPNQQPYAGQQPYPGQSPYPAQSAYPPVQPPYPAVQQSYPPAQQQYPQAQQSYPPAQQQYPAVQQAYPQQPSAVNQPGANQAPVPNQAWRYPLPATNPQPQVPSAQAAAPPVARTQPTAMQVTQPATAQTASAQVVQPATSETTAAGPPSAQSVLFRPGQIVARVGDKSILYADVAPSVNIILALVMERAKKEKSEAQIAQIQAQIEASREAITKSEIGKAIQNKMFFIEFERGMPSEIRTDAKKRGEMETKQRKIVRNAFESSLSSAREKLATATPDEIDTYLQQEGTIVRLALLMNYKKLESYGELDRELRQYGTSLEHQVRLYGEYIMGMEALQSAIKGNPHAKGKANRGFEKKEVTHEEMLDYYEKHQSEYYIPAKARFEILTARFSRFNGDKQAAQNHIIMMGNEVLLGGVSFAAVARKHSQEPHASEGGKYDWVTPGGLASKPVDQAIFSIEVDKLSQVIEDDLGFHIVHVLERKQAGRISFLEAQENIRKAIESARRSAEQQKFFAELKARTKIWTIYDSPVDEAVKPASAVRQ